MTTYFTTQLINWFMTGRKNNHKVWAKSTTFCTIYNAEPVRVAILAEALGEGTETIHLVAETIEEIIEALRQPPLFEKQATNPQQPPLTLDQWLKTALNEANQTIYLQKEQEPTEQKGVIVLVAAVHNNELAIAHLGNSRAYLVRQQTSYQLTLDHTKAQALILAGKLDTNQARTHSTRFEIRQWLGKQTVAEVDARLIAPADQPLNKRALRPKLSLQPGDCIVLCSSGLITALRDQQIAEAVHGRPPQWGARRLVRWAQNDNENLQALVLPYAQGLELSLFLLKRVAVLCLLLFILLLGYQLSQAPLSSAWDIALRKEPTVSAFLRAHLPWGQSTPGQVTATPSSTPGTPTPQATQSIVATTGVASATATLSTALSLTPPITFVPAEPTLTVTPRPTLKPATATASMTPTLTSIITSTPTLSLTVPVVNLLSPAPDTTVHASVLFTWSANFNPATGEAFELIFWRKGQDPLSEGLGWGGLSKIPQTTVDFSALKVPKGEYFWGVRLVQTEPTYKLLKFLNAERRLVVDVVK